MSEPRFLIGPSADPQLRERVTRVAQQHQLREDYAWAFVVDEILTALMEERDYAGLNEIISVASGEAVRMAHPCLSFETWQADSGEAYPVLRFVTQELVSHASGQPIMITRELIETLAQSLGSLYRTESVQVMLTDAKAPS